MAATAVTLWVCTPYSQLSFSRCQLLCCLCVLDSDTYHTMVAAGLWKLMHAEQRLPGCGCWRHALRAYTDKAQPGAIGLPSTQVVGELTNAPLSFFRVILSACIVDGVGTPLRLVENRGLCLRCLSGHYPGRMLLGVASLSDIFQNGTEHRCKLTQTWSTKTSTLCLENTVTAASHAISLHHSWNLAHMPNLGHIGLSQNSPDLTLSTWRSPTLSLVMTPRN